MANNMIALCISNFPSKTQLWSSTAFATSDSQLLRGKCVTDHRHSSLCQWRITLYSMFSSIYPTQLDEFQEIEPSSRNCS